ncbi:MAG TPA: endonuclease/exonuclease/phosphatase family protein [Acidimicrobiales bacterium]|nr:endonuclease/exonuclease/phosphatase family protein [Acidimicrobiales bacterium]
MPPPLRVATYNLHAGVDGWGRRTDVVDVAVEIGADVLFLQEAWQSDEVDLVGEIAARTGATARTVSLASGYRVTGGTGPPRWQPRRSLLVGNEGLYLDSVLPIGRRAKRRLAVARGVEAGEWCIGIVTRLPVISTEVLELAPLARDRARRRLVALELDAGNGVLRCFAVHGAHLSHGSLGQYRELVGHLNDRLDADSAAVFGGDLNCWGPIARRVLRGWRQAARGATWPSWRPHSQLDHLFVHGPIEVVSGGVLDRRSSDHRPAQASIVVRPSLS